MRRYDREKNNSVHVHPIDVYNRAKAARPAAPTNPPATKWLPAEPDLLGLAAAVEEPPAPAPAPEPDAEDGAMLVVTVDPAELVVVTTPPLIMLPPVVVLVVMVAPEELVVVIITTPPAPAPPPGAPVDVMLPLTVDVKVLPVESVPVVTTMVVAPVAFELIDERVEVKVLPAESVPVVTTTVTGPALEELIGPLRVEVKV